MCFAAVDSDNRQKVARRKVKSNFVPYCVNWGRPGDELLDVPIDSRDPSYDSAEENFEKVYFAHKSSSQTVEVDWAVFVKEAEFADDRNKSTNLLLSSDNDHGDSDSFFFEVTR